MKKIRNISAQTRGIQPKIWTQIQSPRAHQNSAMFRPMKYRCNEFRIQPYVWNLNPCYSNSVLLQRHLCPFPDGRHFVISCGTLWHHAVGKPVNALDAAVYVTNLASTGCLKTGTLGRTDMLSVNRFRGLRVRNASVEALYLKTHRERIDKFPHVLNHVTKWTGMLSFIVYLYQQMHI